MSKSNYYNVYILTACNAFAYAAAPLLLLLGSLLGAKLAPSMNLATLPITAMVVGTAIGILPATQAMKAIGRKRGFTLFFALGIISCFLASYAIEKESFTLFCFSAALFGFTNAAVLQLRFAAMESVSSAQAPMAASLVMCGGIIAAILGPELAMTGQNLTSVEYQGSFALIALCFVIAAILVSLTKTPTFQYEDSTNVVQPKRSLTEMLQSPSFRLAVTSGVIGYVLMTFIMTATPISMHHHHGHSLADTKWVIQSHIAAMFIPSLFTPILFRYFKIQTVMMMGLCCYGILIPIAFFDNSVFSYWFQLVALGIGWNLLFVSGTSLLATSHTHEERFKAQSFNDSLVFSLQALASLIAGWAINVSSWHVIILSIVTPIFIMSLMLLNNIHITNKNSSPKTS